MKTKTISTALTQKQLKKTKWETKPSQQEFNSYCQKHGDFNDICPKCQPPKSSECIMKDCQLYKIKHTYSHTNCSYSNNTPKTEEKQECELIAPVSKKSPQEKLIARYKVKGDGKFGKSAKVKPLKETRFLCGAENCAICTISGATDITREAPQEDGDSGSGSDGGGSGYAGGIGNYPQEKCSFCGMDKDTREKSVLCNHQPPTKQGWEERFDKLQAVDDMCLGISIPLIKIIGSHNHKQIKSFISSVIKEEKERMAEELYFWFHNIGDEDIEDAIERITGIIDTK